MAGFQMKVPSPQLDIQAFISRERSEQEATRGQQTQRWHLQEEKSQRLKPVLHTAWLEGRAGGGIADEKDRTEGSVKGLRSREKGEFWCPALSLEGSVLAARLLREASSRGDRNIF
jgi:hypothetical protein